MIAVDLALVYSVGEASILFELRYEVTIGARPWPDFHRSALFIYYSYRSTENCAIGASDIVIITSAGETSG